MTNTIAFGWLSLQLQASGPLKVLSASRCVFLCVNCWLVGWLLADN